MSASLSVIAAAVAQVPSCAHDPWIRTQVPLLTAAGVGAGTR